MRKLFILTNHSITAEQALDAKKNMGVDALVDLPPELKQKWGAVPPEPDSVSGYVAEFLDWVAGVLSEGDVVWVQGEFGATVTVVDWCRAHGVRAVYATTKRVATEVHTPMGVNLTHVFRHVRFRDYPGK